MINFIIPSVGRKTITKTLLSLVEQTNENWEAWVGFDGISENDFDKSLLIEDSKIHYLYIKDRLGQFDHSSGQMRPTGNAGAVRNYILSQIDNDYEWIGYVDDDDTIRPYYVEKLSDEINSTYFDCCIFRMEHNDKKNNVVHIIPPPGMSTIMQNYVGISFTVKKEFLQKNNISFINSSSEDYSLLEAINNCGGVIFLSEYIAYDVRPGEE